ncbi:hypothetical protein BBJ28_00002776 [Nothophytophthora sp. Chile5]|nr:hypothetical protein BBJ28_00002776 [Nothophytophthora sp. Chile5]
MDGLAESLHVEIVTPLRLNETIRQATVLIVLNYTLQVRAIPSFSYLENRLRSQLQFGVESTDTANFYAPYPIWTSDVGQQALSTDLRQFQTQLNIRINPIDVIYRPQWPENMNKFLEDAQNPEFQQVLEQAFRELGTDADGENIEQLLGSLKTDTTPDETDDVNAGVAKTLQNMAKAAEDMEGMGTAQVENMGEEMMSEMMKKFEEMGEKSDFQDLVDGMMQQLLSKDVMYDPMKQICERWLAEKESMLSKEDYERCVCSRQQVECFVLSVCLLTLRWVVRRYGKQYQYFQQIVAMYESEPDNFARLSELMQEMQETGQPPSEIVKDLAPGNAHERVASVEFKSLVEATPVELALWEQVRQVERLLARTGGSLD